MSPSSNTSSTPLILRLVHESTQIVNVAGGIVRKVLKSGNLHVVDKGINDLQTLADRAAQTYIIRELKNKFPNASIIGEEGEDVAENLDDLLSPVGTPSSPPVFPEILMKTVPEPLNSISEDQLVIWIDPLDGTTEFTKGFVTHVTVLVGIAYNGIPIGGVIHQPFLENEEITGRTLWGIPGVGYGGFTVIPPTEGKRIVTTTTSHSNARVEAAVACLKADDVIRVGGAGYKAILLMEGKANAYVFASPGCKKWDTCAPEAILTAIGGKLTDMDGLPYSYSKNVQHVNAEGLLATAPGEDHDWYVKQIPQ